MHKIIFLIGPSGSGKTYVAKFLAKELKIKYIEADHFHSKKNKNLMQKNISLSDKNRLPWLIKIKKKIDKTPTNLIISCSLIKNKYRIFFKDPEREIFFLHLFSPYRLLKQKNARRKHFFNKKLQYKQYFNFEKSNNIFSFRYRYKESQLKQIKYIIQNFLLKKNNE